MRRAPLRHDRDGDGVLTNSEAVGALRQAARLNLSRARIDGLLSKFGGGAGSGTLNIVEFRSILRRVEKRKGAGAELTAAYARVEALEASASHAEEKASAPRSHTLRAHKPE